MLVSMDLLANNWGGTTSGARLLWSFTKFQLQFLSVVMLLNNKMSADQKQVYNA